jgi:hypothetical protein
MSMFVTGAIITGVTILVLLHFGWVIAIAFMVWSLATYGTGMYQGAYLRDAARGGMC